MREPRRVLVLDGAQGAALAVVRSLGRRGVLVDVGERALPCLSGYSRHARQAFSYPDPLAEPAAFVEALRARLRAVAYDLVIPIAEDTVLPLAKARDELERLAPLAIAPSAALEVMVDKARTFALAEELGVPIPASRTFTSLEELTARAPALPYPVVVKPARSISTGGARVKLNVAYAHDPGQLLALAKGPLTQSGAVLVQEYFRGQGVGVELLADHGEVVYLFQHRRLHELPLTGGGSCLRESVALHPRLADYARRLMRAVSWHGVAMVELKHDPATDDARLMEVNGRFWGSLPLAVAAGADFPWMLLELYTRGRRPVLPPARTGVVSRKLSADVYWYVQVLRADQDEPLIRWPEKGQLLRDGLLALSPRHHFDVQSLGDPRPGLVDLWQTGRWFVERAQAVRAQRARGARHAALQRSGALVRDHLPGKRRLLFVCYGNINRSALAQRHLESTLPLNSPCQLRSAGFHPEEGRPADPPMVAEASRHGLDLSSWSSRALSQEDLQWADLVLVMELKHLERLEEAFPGHADKSFLLSALSPEVPLQIADPYGGDQATFAECYRQITTCTRALAGALTETKT